MLSITWTVVVGWHCERFEGFVITVICSICSWRRCQILAKALVSRRWLEERGMLAATRTTLAASPYRLVKPNPSLFRSVISSSVRPSLSTPALRSSITGSPVFAFSTSLSRTMSAHHLAESTVRPEADKVLQDIANYVHTYQIDSELAFETARLCLIDTIGCGLEALRFPECTKLLGPVVEGTIVPNGLYLQYLLPSIYILVRIFACRYSCARD